MNPPTPRIQDIGMAYKPSRMEQFWKKLGFRYRHADLPDDIDKTNPGRVFIETHMQFSLVDRLRFLITGRLWLFTRIATTDHVRNAAASTSYRILPPGEKFS